MESGGENYRNINTSVVNGVLKHTPLPPRRPPVKAFCDSNDAGLLILTTVGQCVRDGWSPLRVQVVKRVSEF